MREEMSLEYKNTNSKEELNNKKGVGCWIFQEFWLNTRSGLGGSPL